MKILYFNLILLSITSCLKPVEDAKKDSTTMKVNDFWIGWFENGIAQISQDGYFGLMDSSEHIICPPKYDRIFRFHHGVAIMSLDNKYGIIDQTGNEVLPPSLSFISDFDKGMAWFYDQEQESWGIIGKDGSTIHEATLSVVRKYQNDHFVFTGQSLINSDKEVLFELDASAFVRAKGERANLSNAKEYVRQGRVIPFFLQQQLIAEKAPGMMIPTPPDLLFFFQENRALFLENVNSEVKLGYLDTQGKTIIAPTFDNAQHFLNGKACVKQDGLWGLIDSTGKLVMPYQYEYLEQTASDYLIFGSEQKFGIIDASGKVIIPAEYFAIRHLFGTVFTLLKDTPATRKRIENFGYHGLDINIDTWGAINVLTGKTVLPFNYHRVSAVNENFGIGLSYSFSTISQSQSFQNSAVPGFGDFKGQAYSKVFNADQTLGQYESKQVDFFDANRSTPAQMRAILPYEQIDGFYNFNERFTDANGVEIQEESQIALLKQKSNRSKLVLLKEEASGLQICKNLEGELIIPPICDELQIVHSGIIGRKKDKWMFFDLRGKEIIPPTYDQIKEYPSGVLSVNFNNSVYLIDKRENRITQ